MKDILEIIIALFAAIGLARVFELVRDALLYPMHVRRRLIGAVMDCDDSPEVRAWAAHLKSQGKICDKRLIIVRKCDIIEDNTKITREEE